MDITYQAVVAHPIWKDIYAKIWMRLEVKYA